MNEDEKYEPPKLLTMQEASKRTKRSTKYLRNSGLRKIRLVPLGPIRYLESEVEQLIHKIQEEEKEKHERRRHGDDEYHQDNHT